MKKLFAALSLSLLAQFAHADVMKVDFTTTGYTGNTTQVASIASLTLTLNENGTIAALLSPVANLTWYGVSIDSITHYSETAISQGSQTSWGTGFGNFQTGLVCSSGCSGTASWTISATSPFVSVSQLFTGTGSAYDAWFYSTSAQYAGMAVVSQSTNVPEPTSIALLGLGLAAVGIARRRGQRA